jgi:hypothetical protein
MSVSFQQNNQSTTRSGLPYGINNNVYPVSSASEYPRSGGYVSGNLNGFQSMGYNNGSDQGWQTWGNTQYNKYKGKFGYGGRKLKKKHTRKNTKKNSKKRIQKKSRRYYKK